MRFILSLSAVALSVVAISMTMATMPAPVHAGGAWADYGRTVGFQTPLQRANGLQEALAIEFMNNGGFRQNYYTTINDSENFQTKNVQNNMSVGNWSSVSCSGSAYCNVDQSNEDSNQQSAINNGDTVNADQIGDDKKISKSKGGYANE